MCTSSPLTSTGQPIEARKTPRPEHSSQHITHPDPLAEYRKRSISSYVTQDKVLALRRVLKPGEVAKFIRFKNYVGFHCFPVYPGRPLASRDDTIERVSTMLWETLPPNRKRFWLEKAEHADGYESDGDGYDGTTCTSAARPRFYEAIVLADTARVHLRARARARQAALRRTP